MLDYLLNKLSKYIKIEDPGKLLTKTYMELRPDNVVFAEQFLGKEEVKDKVYLTTMLGVNPINTPWCAAFVNMVEKQCGRSGTGKMLARSFLKYGRIVSTPQLGDIVIFKRGNSSWQGHVGYYITSTHDTVTSLGGNQSNSVCYANYLKSSVLGYRRPI